MHLADGFADPKVWATFDVVSGVTVAYAARKARAIVKPEQTASMGMAAAFIFAAQMVNFKVGPSSGHFVGAVLAGILFGPFVGTIVMAAVVVLQALFFADGGLAALGINVFNMGLVGTFLGYYVYEGLTRILRFRAGEYVAAFAAAYLSLVTGAALLCLQLALFQPQVSLGPLFAMMISVHLLIGLGEGAVTVGALLVVRRVMAEGTRPQPQAAAAPRVGWVVAGAIVAIALATVGAQFASRLPDGLEHSLAQQHVQPGHAPAALPAWWLHRFDDYQTRGLAQPAVSLGAAGLVGVMLALLLVSVAGSLLAGRSGSRLKPLPREDASKLT